jgi:hypothetical protein
MYSFTACVDICADGDNHDRIKRLLFSYVLYERLFCDTQDSKGQSDQGSGLLERQHAKDDRQLGGSTS